MVMRLMVEILCCSGVFFMVSLIGAALLQSGALCGSCCCDEGHSDRHILYLRMKKSKDVLLVRESGRNSCEYSE